MPSWLGFQEPKSNKCKPTGKTKKPSAQVADQTSQLSNLTSLARIFQGLKPRSKEGERVGESNLGGCFVRCGVERIGELTVRNEGRAIYTSIQDNYRYYWCQMLVLPAIRSDRWKGSYTHQRSAQNWPTGTTRPESILPTNVGTTNKKTGTTDRSILRALELVQIWSASTTDVLSVLPT